MNKEQISKLKELIDNSENILLQLHANPDPDSFGGVLAWYEVLSNLDTNTKQKNIKIICPGDIQKNFETLFEDISKVEFDVDFSKVDYSEFDLFLVNDTASFKQLSLGTMNKLPEMNIFMIDHHASNEFHDTPRILETNIISTCEILFTVFEKLEIEITPKIATYLLCGIYTDAFYFKAPGITADTFRVCGELMQKGADFEYLQNKLINSKNTLHINAVGNALQNMHSEEVGKTKFSWTYISNEDYKKYGEDYSVKDVVSDEYISTIEGTEFGLFMLEIEPGPSAIPNGRQADKAGKIKLSLRSNKEFDVSKLAIALGGGGHKHSAGGVVEGKSEKEIIEEVKKILI